MKILLSGSSGLVGSAFQEFLKGKEHTIVRLVRHKQGQDDHTILWDSQKHFVDGQSLEGFDAVVHLSGENIAGGRWNEALKQKILDSRVKSTQLLSQTFSTLNHPPRVFVSASAVGFYGNCGDMVCTEKTECGIGFLADVCRQWEEAANLAGSIGIRTVNLRFGVILSAKGGVLAKMLTPFKFGLGGMLGSGNQYMSWIAIDDVVAIILQAIENSSLTGPINVVAPNPVTNRQFTKTLGEVLHRPTIMTVPAFVLRFLLGREMADEMLLSSVRAMPECLLNSGYHFIYPNLNEALQCIR